MDDAQRRFVEAATGSRLVASERAGSGASRVTWLLRVAGPEGERGLVLRCDPGDGPLSGSELSLAREASVYRALRDSGVRLPRLLAEAPDGRALLLERAPGQDAFAAIADGAARNRVALDFFGALAALHALDPRALELPGLARPRDERDAARLELALWRRIAERDGPLDALLALAFGWLDDAAPPAARVALCHGDAGPGNFLFEGERVTALLDWEFAHLGDPHDDLAWVAVRAQLLGGFGDLRAGLRVWARALGASVDPVRVEYYRGLVLLRMIVACRAGLARRGDAGGVYGLLLPYLRGLLPEALARAGCDAAGLDGLARAGRAELAAHPVLRTHARPLDPLPAP